MAGLAIPSTGHSLPQLTLTASRPETTMIGSPSTRRIILTLAFFGSAVLFRSILSSKNATAAVETRLKPVRDYPPSDSVSATLPDNDLSQTTLDGCGRLVDKSPSPKWKKLGEIEALEFNEVLSCMKRNKLGPKFLQNEPVNETLTLQCNTEVSMQNARATLQKFQTVLMIGDSIMEHQFLSLACTMNSSITLGTGVVGTLNTTRDHEKFSFQHAGGGNTNFIFSRFGHGFAEKEINLYQRAFPRAIENFGHNDAILIGAGAHYRADRAHLLESIFNFIASQSNLSNSSIYLMEPTPEEWPSSNGFFVRKCYHLCKCETLNAHRLIGRGKFLENNLNNMKTIDFSDSKDEPVADVFVRLYPDLIWANDTSECMPNCVPATWRLDLMDSILRNGTAQIDKQHRLNIVPIFWQFVGKGAPSGRGTSAVNVGDCTHKTLYSTIIMNQQWVRTIRSVHR